MLEAYRVEAYFRVLHGEWNDESKAIKRKAGKKIIQIRGCIILEHFAEHNRANGKFSGCYLRSACNISVLSNFVLTIELNRKRQINHFTIAGRPPQHRLRPSRLPGHCEDQHRLPTEHPGTWLVWIWNEREWGGGMRTMEGETWALVIGIKTESKWLTYRKNTLVGNFEEWVLFLKIFYLVQASAIDHDDITFRGCSSRETRSKRDCGKWDDELEMVRPADRTLWLVISGGHFIFLPRNNPIRLIVNRVFGDKVTVKNEISIFDLNMACR